MTYLDFPKMLGNYWKRPVNVYEQYGTGGADACPSDAYPSEDAVRSGSILRDLLIWGSWMLAALVGTGVLLLLPGWLSG